LTCAISELVNQRLFHIQCLDRLQARLIEGSGQSGKSGDLER
jgi:hypothetical protein